MYFQNILTAFQIRTLHDDPAVKTARSKQGLIENFRTVGCRQNNACLITLESIHLCQKLIQCLLTFIISSETGITAFSNGINLIDKHDTGSIFLCFFKKITNTGCTHTYEHLYKIRTCQREEGHMGLSCHGFCKKCLASSRRTYKQSSFRQFRTNLSVLCRIMKEIHHLYKGFLRLFLTCHILKCNTCLFFNINLGFALADTHHAASTAHTAHKQAECQPQQKDWRQNGNNIPYYHRPSILNIRFDLHTFLFHEWKQVVITHLTGIIALGQSGLRLLLRRNLPGSSCIFHTGNLIRFQHIYKRIICNFLCGCFLVLITHQSPKKESYHKKHQKHHHVLGVFRKFSIIFLVSISVWSVVVVHLFPPCA